MPIPMTKPNPQPAYALPPGGGLHTGVRARHNGPKLAIDSCASPTMEGCQHHAARAANLGQLSFHRRAVASGSALCRLAFR